MWKQNLSVNSRTLRLLEEIAALREKIASAGVRLPWIPSLAREAAIGLAHGSTAIEGSTLSLEAVGRIFDGKDVAGYPEKEIIMARNYIEAIKWIKKNQKKKRVIIEDILELHGIIAAGTLEGGKAGKLRTVDVKAGLHFAPGWRKVPALVNELVGWINGEGDELPPVISSAMIHLKFVTIHPFKDGNGRCARALATWELYRKGFDTMHIFSLDEVLNEERSYYIKNLQKVQVEKAPVSGWLEYICEAVLETLERAYKRIISLELNEDLSVTLTPRQEQLLRLLQEKHFAGIRDIAGVLKTTLPGAHFVMKPLIKAGIVEALGGHKNVKYRIHRKISSKDK